MDRIHEDVLNDVDHISDKDLGCSCVEGCDTECPDCGCDCDCEEEGCECDFLEICLKNGCDCSFKARDAIFLEREGEVIRELKNALTSCLESAVDNINRWALRGPQMNIYDRPQRHKTGVAVELTELSPPDPKKWDWDDEIVCLQLHRPFLVVYAEAAFCVHGAGDEGNQLSDCTAQTVVRVGEWIAECEGGFFCSELS
jgi:hypothetical protein